MPLFKLSLKKDYKNIIDTKVLDSLEAVELNVKNSSVKLRKGGFSISLDNHGCESNLNVAIIIPYRDRLPNIKVFLNNMHQFLTRQKINYGIYLIEPVEKLVFNRGLLMNIGKYAY